MSGRYPKGGMSRKGTTTPVRLNLAEIDDNDKDVLCMAICECKAVPDIGKNGQSLRQVCVSKMLNKRDTLKSYQSEHKAEINYDMTKSPPAPIMDYEIKTMAHAWAPGWIKKHWNDDPTHPLWMPGEGYVRRPDVVIVKDPSKPPTKDNIKQVVEIKFDGDKWGEFQEEEYLKISGRGKLAELTPSDCNCDDPERKKRTKLLKNTELKDELLGMLDIAGGRGRRGRSRMPKKLPSLKD